MLIFDKRRKDSDANTKGRPIFEKEEAKAMAMEIFNKYQILVNLSHEEALAISNENKFWLALEEDMLLFMLQKLRTVHEMIGILLDNSETKVINPSYHFKKRAIERYSEKEILNELRISILNSVRWAISTKPERMVKKEYIDPQTDILIGIVVWGKKSLKIVTCFTPKKEDSKNQKNRRKESKKGKKNKETRAERRLRKALEKKERD